MKKIVCSLFVAFLCSATAAPENYPLHAAAERGDAAEVERLLNSGVNVDATPTFDGHTPLHIAVSFESQHHRECVEILLSWQADVNAQYYNGSTPLHYAAADGSADSVHALLKRGADMSVQNTYGFTPLHYAAEKGRKDIVDILLRAGADADVKDGLGRIPKAVAAAEGKKDVVEFFNNYQPLPEIKELEDENENEKS